jgi:glucan phosphoethanolaminetransferase (alkaline phosphatase superfamily)
MIGVLLNLIVYLLIAGILIALVYWLLDAIPVPEPINRIIKIVLVVVAVLVIVMLLLQLLGGGGVSLPKLT